MDIYKPNSEETQDDTETDSPPRNQRRDETSPPIFQYPTLKLQRKQELDEYVDEVMYLTETFLSKLAENNITPLTIECLMATIIDAKGQP